MVLHYMLINVFYSLFFNWLPVAFSTAVSTVNLDDLVEVSRASPKSHVSKFLM